VIVLTFPSIAKGETAIRAQDAGTGLDVTVGYCCRIGGLGWTAFLYALADRPGTSAGEMDRPTQAELRNAVCGRLERSGKWWR
jgi:hypothetical protein